ncbi:MULTISPECIES: sodium-dependent bicarbonate transport family permease [Microbacterium]|uniref:sodium-dependent bicarbonate transport family permease n=1 Tax=Microbacterium TaxID=33882 RepID=UPI00146B4706|nr:MULTISPECIES: sodium-dependent bicarbonate transport family permease [Microbacterium]
MDASTAVTSLLSAPVLAFVLGVVAVAVRSDLKVPDALTQTLSIYLLLAIGVKGGVALADTDPASLAVPLLLALGFGLLTPVLAYFALRVLTRLGPVDRGSIAAHYGSTSLVTFTAALVALESAQIAVPGYAATVLTVLEIPGILVGLLLARRHTARHAGWGTTIHEILTGKSILLLAGGLAIGAIVGEAGYAPIEPFFGDPFRGALVLFLLALGIEAAHKFAALRTSTAGLIAFAIGFPLLIGSAAVLAGAAAGLGVGGAAILGVLCASASYIAAPAAVRMSLPDANLAYPLATSLGITFPVNLTIGIPLYTALALTFA